MIGLVKSDHENLVDAMSNEYVEYTKMYLDMAKRAEAAGDTNASRYFTEIAADEANHRDIFKGAMATQKPN